MKIEQAMRYWKDGNCIYRKGNTEAKSDALFWVLEKEDALHDDWTYCMESHTNQKRIEDLYEDIREYERTVGTSLSRCRFWRKWIGRFFKIAPMLAGAFAGWIFEDCLKVIAISLIVLSMNMFERVMQYETGN